MYSMYVNTCICSMYTDGSYMYSDVSQQYEHAWCCASQSLYAHHV